MYLLTAFLAALAVLLNGCTYAISSDARRQADRTIAFSDLNADPAKFAGKTVILGGVIVQTRNVKDGALIEIQQKELDYWGKPRRTDKTGGRFLARHAGFLEPLVYAPGREVTLAAEVAGTEEKGLAEEGSLYPLVVSKELKLWPREPRASDRPGMLDPLYDRYSTDNVRGY